MSKIALCVARADIAKLVSGISSVYNEDEPTQLYTPYPYDDFLNLTASLYERSECETRYDLLQIIPYLTIINSLNNKVFVYTRGNLGNEKRLIGKCSIGVGGHIEELPQTPGNPDSFENLLVESALRELTEEVGVNLDFDEFLDFKHRFKEQSKLIYNDLDPVGGVHLGIHLTIRINPSEMNNFEKDVITNGHWLSLVDLNTRIKSGLVQLESWSNTVFNNRDQFIKTKV